jgi:hypothetical protein
VRTSKPNKKQGNKDSDCRWQDITQRGM